MNKLRAFWPQHLMVCLGLFGLTNLWGQVFIGRLRVAVMAFFLACALVVALREALCPGVFKAEMANPMGLASIVGGCCSVYFTAAWLYADGLSAGGTQALWALAFAVNMAVLVRFIQLLFRGPRSWEAVTPMWYFLFLGTGVAAIPAPAMGLATEAKILAVVTLINYIWITPPVLIRVFAKKPLPLPAEPTKAIIMAAPSMTNVALMNAFGLSLPAWLAALLVVLGQIFFFWFFILHARHFLSLPFGPAWCAFTFPFAICTTSLRVFCTHYGAGPALTLLWQAELGLATVIIFAVLFLYLRRDAAIIRGTITD